MTPAPYSYIDLLVKRHILDVDILVPRRPYARASSKSTLHAVSPYDTDRPSRCALESHQACTVPVARQGHAEVVLGPVVT